MKRFYLITAIILLTGSIYAQSWSASAVGYIQTYPQFQLVEHNSPEVIKMLRTSDTTNAQYQNYVKYITGDNFYSFFRDKKLYMLSYDTCSTCYQAPSVEKPITRGLYLFRLDVNKWTKVSESLQTDYYKLLSNTDEPIWSKFCYVPSKKYNSPNVKDGNVIVSTDGEVTIVLINYKEYLESGKDYKRSYENRTIVLVPNVDGTYKVK
jgi:hypothetical protein